MDEEVLQCIDFQMEGETVHPFQNQEQAYIQWLQGVADEEGRSLTLLTYVFCSDEYLLDVNITYLGHDYYTDIITFPYKEGTEIESDLYISIDRVAENAIDYEVTFENELRRVMVHGLLHLIGYGDKTEEEIQLIRQKEDYYIDTFKDV
jgi:probable rRNA maturation factor